MPRIPHDDDAVSVLSATDDLSDHYATVAASSESGTAKEAAMQFVIAEGHIKEGEGYEDAIRSANKALALFRKAQDIAGIADSQRLIIHAYRLKADLLLQTSAGRKEAQTTLKQAEEMASENAAVFKQLGDARCEAAMLVSLAEVKMQSNAKRNEAVKAVTKAQALCKSQGDRSLQGCATLVLGHIYLKQEKGNEAIKAALEARTLFRAVKNGIGEAKALHTLAMGRSLIGEGVEAIGAANSAEALYRSLNLEKQAALEQLDVARLCLEQGDKDESLGLIEILEGTFTEAEKTGDDSYKGWGNVVSCLKIKALTAAGKAEEAGAIAEDMMMRYPEQVGADYLWALKAQALLLQGTGAIDNAMGMVKEGLRVCKENLGGNEKWETSLTFMAAEMLCAAGKKDGVEWAGEAREQFNKIGDKLGEVKAVYLLAQQHVNSNNPEAALKAARQGRSLAAKSEQRSVEAAMLIVTAKAHLAMGEEEEGMGATQESAAIAKEMNDGRNEMEALKLAAAIYKANDEQQDAIETARKAQGKARDLGDKMSELELLRWQSQLHADHGHTKSALRAAKDAMRVGKATDKKTQAQTLLLVAERYLVHLQAEAEQQAEPAKLIQAKANLVLKPASESVQLAKDLEDQQLESLALIIKGQIANNVFRADEALTCSEEALAIAEEISDKHCQAGALILAAEAQHSLGRMDLATELAGKAQPIAGEINDQAVKDRCKKFVQPVVRGRGGGGGGRRRVKIGTKKVKRMVEKRIGGGGGGGAVLALPDVKDMSMRVLKMLAEEEIGFDDPLMDSGIDSLSSITFRNDLSKQTGMKLPGTLMFDFPTLGAVADFIVDESKNSGGGEGDGGEVRIEMVEEEVEESEYEWVDDDDYAPRSRRRKIGTKKVKKWVQKMVGGGGGGGGAALALPDVKDMSMRVLKMLAEEEIGFDDPLMDSGIDSLSSITFRNDLSKQTGMKLPGTLMFDFPTLGAVADFIVDESKSAAAGGDGGGGGGDGPGELQWVEEEVEESEYEDVDDDYGAPPPRAVSDAPAAMVAAASGAPTTVAKQALDLNEVKTMLMGVVMSLAEAEVGYDDPLMDSGMDSLSAITFRNDVSKKTNLKLPGTLMFDFPTLGGVAQFIVDESAGQ